MNKEPLENIRIVCNKHIIKSDKDYSIYPDEFFLNKFIKIKFSDQNNQNEHCWVKVNSCIEHKIDGTLENDPVLNIGFIYGDIIKTDVSEIELMMDPTTDEFI